MPVKPSGPILGEGAIRVIHRAVERAFDRAKARVLGPQSVGKHIAFEHNHHLSIPGIFEQAAREEGYVPDLRTLKQLLGIAGSYLDSTREQVKARITKEVSAFLENAHASGVKTDLTTVLGGKISEVLDSATVSMRRIVDSEVQQAKNVSIMDGIGRINASLGIGDPVVYFCSVNDDSRCDECTRLHCMEDGITPRLWKLSEVSHAYHKKGENSPSIGGLHCQCRCTLATMTPGFSFSAAGKIEYRSQGHDELAKQRG